MVLKGGGKGVKGQTFKPFDLLQFVANEPDIEGACGDVDDDSDGDSDGGSDAVDFANLQRRIEAIALADDRMPTSPRIGTTSGLHAPGKRSAPRGTVHSPAAHEDLREAPNHDTHLKGVEYPWRAIGATNHAGASWVDTGMCYLLLM